ncbi:MAG: YHS domain-containing protein [Alphaproteobacteria bacterium]|nr:YHS domain-containing protein [Alphaproteobacteria bacterium]
MNIRAISLAVLASLAAAFAGPAVAADKSGVYTGRLSNLAVDGHDPVAYFEAGAPTKGSADYQYTYNGAEWRFASQANLDAFKANPDAYAPQYGGYCAWAVSQGYTARGNPNNWTIRNGKLYLNYNDKVQATWSTDPDGFIRLADGNWPTVLAK